VIPFVVDGSPVESEVERVLFLIEGDIYKTRSGMPPDAIRGALSYLVAIEGVSVVTVGGVHETASLLVTLARHLQEGLGYEPPLHASKPKNLADISEYIVSALPGIGTTTARTLLAHLGSAEAVLTSSVAQLCSVPGVGKKTAERIREALLAKAGDAGAAV